MNQTTEITNLFCDRVPAEVLRTSTEQDAQLSTGSAVLHDGARPTPPSESSRPCLPGRGDGGEPRAGVAGPSQAGRQGRPGLSRSGRPGSACGLPHSPALPGWRGGARGLLRTVSRGFASFNWPACNCRCGASEQLAGSLTVALRPEDARTSGPHVQWYVKRTPRDI